MITNLSPGSYLTVSGSSGGTYYNNSGQPMAGMLRYQSGGRVEVYDGNSWLQVNGYQTVDLSPDTQQIIEWARSKMQEEISLKALAKEHPAVQIAVENLNKAKQQLETTIILSKEHITNEETAS